MVERVRLVRRPVRRRRRGARLALALDQRGDAARGGGAGAGGYASADARAAAAGRAAGRRPGGDAAFRAPRRFFSLLGDMPKRAVNPWVNGTWRVTTPERLKMAALAPLVLPPRVAVLVGSVLTAIVFSNLATIGWEHNDARVRLADGSTRRVVLPDDRRMPRWRFATGGPARVAPRAAVRAGYLCASRAVSRAGRPFPRGGRS